MGQQGRQRILDHFRLEQMTENILAACEAAGRNGKRQPRRFPELVSGAPVQRKRWNICGSPP